MCWGEYAGVMAPHPPSSEPLRAPESPLPHPAGHTPPAESWKVRKTGDFIFEVGEGQGAGKTPDASEQWKQPPVTLPGWPPPPAEVGPSWVSSRFTHSQPQFPHGEGES